MLISKTSLSIRPLVAVDAALLSIFINQQPSEYVRFFYAFGFDEATISDMLSAVKDDVYSGVFWQENLIGVFMLRGWDAGFEIPSFGVLIDDKYRGGAFMRLTLDTAKLICRLNGTRILMAKIHPENISVKGAVRLGFRHIGVEESTGIMIYHMDI